jgi:hypothetical protein
MQDAGRFTGTMPPISRRGGWGGRRWLVGPTSRPRRLTTGRCATGRCALVRGGADLTSGPHTRRRRWALPTSARARWAGEPLGWAAKVPYSWAAARRRAAGPRGGGAKARGPRLPNRPKPREERDGGEMDRWAAPRGQKADRGWKGGSYFLFSSKLLLNEYFTETKQTHKK